MVISWSCLILLYLQAMWGASHNVDNLFSFCTTAILALTGTSSITFSANGCVGTRVIIVVEFGRRLYIEHNNKLAV